MNKKLFLIFVIAFALRVLRAENYWRVFLLALMPIGLYFLIKKFFKKEKIAFYSALTLTFMPWHIYFSRNTIGTSIVSQPGSFREFMSRYLNCFSSRFLAFQGDWLNPGFSTPYIGVLTHIGFVLFILGLLFFLKQEKIIKNYFWIIFLVLIPVPAILSSGVVSSVGFLFMTFPVAFFIGYGWYEIEDKIMNLKFRNKNLIYLLVIISYSLLILDFIYYLDLYYNHAK